MLRINKKFFGFILLLLVLPACKWWSRRRAPEEERVFFIEKYADPVQLPPRPRVLIFSSPGGGGHASAAQAIISYLGDQYHIEVVHIFSEVLGGFDPLRLISANHMSGEDLYNFFLRNGIMWGGGILGRFGQWIMGGIFCPYFARNIETFLAQHKPDLIISVVPFINGAVQRASYNLHIPFAVITVDLDSSNYVSGLQEPYDASFSYHVPFDEQMIRDVIAHAKIPASNMNVLGFPVRPQFLRKGDPLEIKKRWGFPLDRPIIMVLMGGAGSRAILSYARKLAKIKIPHHVIFCLGRNTDLLLHMTHMTFPEHMSVSLLGFTQEIAELMTASDLLITKPGPTSICEALYVGVPLLLDVTSHLMYWEQMNVDFVKKHGLGEVITSLRTVPVVVQRILEDKDRLREMREAMKNVALPNVEQSVQQLVKKLVQQGDAAPDELFTITAPEVYQKELQVPLAPLPPEQ